MLNVVDEDIPAVWYPEKAVEVVGVVRNTRDGSLGDDYGNQIYLPITPGNAQPVLFALLRGPATPAEAASGLRRAVTGIDSFVPVTRIRTLNEVVANSVAAPRALAMLLLGFGGLAIIIGAVGVYSLISYIVSWRTREIGLRLALGAQRWQIVLSVVRESLFLAGTGCVVGLAGAVALSRVLRSFLFEVSALDPGNVHACASLDGDRSAHRRVDSCPPRRRRRSHGGTASRLGGRNAENYVRYGSGSVRCSPRIEVPKSLTRNLRATSNKHIDDGLRSGLNESEARRQALLRHRWRRTSSPGLSRPGDAALA